MNLPPRKKRSRMMVHLPSTIVCPGHCKWVRGFACLLNGMHDCLGKIEAHHVTSRGAGGHDSETVPLCSAAHAEIHQIGRQTFRLKYGDIDLAKIAANLWQASPAGKKYRLSHLPHGSLG